MTKTVLVTGSSRGIGSATIIEFAKHGYNVVINYLTNKEKAETLKKIVENKYNAKTLSIKADVTNDKEVKDMFDIIYNTFGNIDVVINNAARENDDTYLNKTKKDFLKTFDVNVYGVFNVIREASKYMNGGVVINVSSTDSIDTYSKLSMDYSASKAALNSLTKSYALAIPNTKFVALLLPWVNTESTKEMLPEYLQSELKRTNQSKLLEPEEVAEKIYEVATSNIDSGILEVLKYV